MTAMPITKTRTEGYTTGELAKRAGVHLENIRYFERIGLIPAARRGANGRREFGPDHYRRLVFIRRARELGFSQNEVRALLQLADGSPRRCAEVKAIAEAHLGAIRRKVAALRKMEQILAAVSAECDSGRRADCPVIDALFDENSSASMQAEVCS